MLKPILLAFTGTLLTSAIGAAESADIVRLCAPGQVSLRGVVGSKFDAVVRERFMSDEARTVIYDEAENAFRTCYDDLNSKGKFGWWQGEYWGKTMLSASEIYSMTGDENLKAWMLEKAHGFVSSYMKPDGYLGSYANQYFVRGEEKDMRKSWCWNVWVRKYTIWALYDIYRKTGDKDCLNAAVKSMDQLIDQLSGQKLRFVETGSFYGLPSCSILKPLLLLYQESRKPEYLETARQIVADMDKADGSHADIIADAFGDRPICEWHPDPYFWAKAYEMMSCLEGFVEYYRVTGEGRVLSAVLRIREKLLQGELNPMQNVGYFDHFVDGAHQPSGLTELCDVIHWIRVNRELYCLTGEAPYLDCAEKAFYNAFLAGVYRDGKWCAHAIRSHGSRHRAAPHQVCMQYHQCCVDNMPRGFVDWAATSFGLRRDGSVDVNFYSPSEWREEGVSVRLDGNYPVDGKIVMKVRSQRSIRLNLRVPGWSRVLCVDGVKRKGPWCSVEIAPGERKMSLEFDMAPRYVRRYTRETVYRTDNFYGKAMADWARHVFESADENPEMKDLYRTKGAGYMMWGPLVLAKGERSGVSRERTLAAETLNQCGCDVSLKPLTCRSPGDWGLWEATLRCGDAVKRENVMPFASVADEDDPSKFFSIWF